MRRTAELAQVEKLISNARYQEDSNVIGHNEEKFTTFRYYAVTTSYKREKKTVDIASLSDQIDTSTVTSCASIKRPCLKGDTQWEMILSAIGRATLVNVEDKKFLQDVRNGKISVSAYTKIEGEFVIKTRTNPRGEIIGKPKISLVKSTLFFS